MTLPDLCETVINFVEGCADDPTTSYESVQDALQGRVAGGPLVTTRRDAIETIRGVLDDLEEA